MASRQAVGPLRSLSAVLLSVFVLAQTVRAHEGHGDSVPEGEAISAEPLDTILWIHIFVQTIAYGIIFPIGMVFGMTKSRWHVPTQAVGSILALLGFFLGHAHGGRDFLPGNVHVIFANILQILLIGQIVLGMYLKGHWERGINGRVRKMIRPMHSILGKGMPILAWTQMLFGGITALGFCQGDHLGQCLAHFIMGSSFIGYAILLTILLLAGQMWIRQGGRSIEFYESAVVLGWGIVNTLTQHRWGGAWVRNDWQHTMMGVIWVCSGLTGIWMSWDRDGKPKRNFIPAFVLASTGWAMSAHPQQLETSAMVHNVFGKTLMLAGATRVIEICFVLKDKHSIAANGREWNSFQYVPVFFIYASGFLFMCATEEQMELIEASEIDHVTYVLIIYSLALIMFLFVHVVIHLWDRNTNPIPDGKTLTNNNIQATSRAMENGQLRDAEEFELHGLMSDDEGEERRRESRRSAEEPSWSSDTPSTVGKNNEDIAR